MNEFSVTKNYNWQTGSELLVKKYVADLYQTGVTALGQEVGQAAYEKIMSIKGKSK